MKRLLCVVGTLLFVMPAFAQWDLKDKGVPRQADGKVKVDAPAPRLPDGRPDLSGLWLIPDIQTYGWNLGKDLEGGGPPMQPWVRKLVDQRIARNLIDDPSSRCFPTGMIGLDIISPFRISLAGDRYIVLFEQNTTYRQIFMDGRSLPKDPTPTYMGYSVGHWEGDTLVVESSGFNGKSWIDADGHPITEKLHLTEHIRRPTFGRLEIELTFNDPLAYTKTWSVRLPFNYVPDSEVTESFCEDNRFQEQLKAAGLEAMDVVPQEPPEGDLNGGSEPDNKSGATGDNLDELLKGLPTKKTDRGLILNVGEVQFGSGQSALKPTADSTLDKIADVLKGVAQRRLTIKGYTDNAGKEDRNVELSTKRAESVRDALVKRGVSPWQITAVGMGSKFPVASNATPSGRQQNRRIEIVFNE
jgi:outer membrane protein OmpA-like peptidoglycan-associated protein